MKLKQGASLEGVSWRMFWAAIVAENVFKQYGSELTITSGVDGKHSATSLHYAGLALDCRTWEVKGREGAVAYSLRNALGPDYDVVVEATHIHIEYDPETT